MDGFYVCKIQKLSDNIKIEEDAGEVDGVEIDADDTEREVVDQKKSNAKKTIPAQGKKGNKKRPTKEEGGSKKKKPKSDKMSVPPIREKKSLQTSSNRKLSAKMTKPRRRTAETSM
jgi:hypothetical protein